MLTLNDGRSELWQWDTGRTLAVDADCSQVHFSNKVFGRSIDVDVVDGMAIIPDIILQTDKELTAWAFVGTAENGYTKISKVFKVNKRNKPADYVFTPTDQTTLGDILDRIENLEKRPSGGNGGITKEVDPTVPDWAKQPQKPTYTAAEVGALPDTTKIPSTAEDVDALPANAFIPKTAADVGAIPVPETATVGQTIVVKEVDESGKPTSWECVDVAGGPVSAPAPLPLLADVISEEAITIFEVTLSKRAVSRVIMKIDVSETEAIGSVCYGWVNGKLWDGYVFGSGALAAGASKWLSLDLMEGGLARFMAANSTGGLWKQGTVNTCGKFQNIEYVDDIGIKIGKADTTIPAGTRIRVWGE